MTTAIQPLVITPRPKQGESLKGFILRTSELNGYESPSMMLASAGMTSGEMCASIPPLEKLYPLYARDAKEFESLGYQRKWEDRRTKNVKLLNHNVPSIYMAAKRSKICPECVMEIGYVEAFWDLKYAIACPIHRREAIQKCEECGHLLNSFRPGLLTCVCGADLSIQKGAEVEHVPTIALLRLVRSKLLGLPYEEESLNRNVGFPVKHLEKMSFETLLGIIGRLEGHSPHTNRYESPKLKDTPVPLVLSRAAQALTNWPNGLHEYLERLNSDGKTKRCYSLRMQFKPFYDAIFKSCLPMQEVAFVKEAFVRFGNEVWKKAYVNQKLDDDSVAEGPLVGIYGLAKKLNVMTSTARHLVESGNIPNVTLTMNGVSRQLFDLSQKLPYEITAGDTYTLRDAASWLGLPVSVLKIVREQGLFDVRHIASPINAYHERDLEIFRKKLLACSPKSKLIPSMNFITLEQCMLMKTGHDDIKASIVSAILNKKLRPLGRASENICDIVILKRDLDDFLNERKSQLFRTTTIVAAAKKLHCDPLVVKSLYQDGKLSGVQNPNGLFIREDSLEAFAEKYVSCAAIASKQNTNSNKIVSLCKEKAVNVYWLPRAENLPPQPFVDRKYADLTWQ